MMRKNHTSSFKAQLVLEMLKEEKTVSELASAYGVHPTMLHRWKKQVVADLPGLFERNKDAKATQEASEQKIEELYTEIGRLSTQLSWLKKKGFDVD
jgi:putative transposase